MPPWAGNPPFYSLSLAVLWYESIFFYFFQFGIIPALPQHTTNLKPALSETILNSTYSAFRLLLSRPLRDCSLQARCCDAQFAALQMSDM